MTDPSTLSDAELNRAIAEAKGWTNLCDAAPNVGGRWEKGGIWGCPPDHPYMERTPDWSTRIAHAWELVEELGPILIGHKWGPKRMFIVVAEGEKQMTLSEDCTAPRAICIAWLLAKKGK